MSNKRPQKRAPPQPFSPVRGFVPGGATLGRSLGSVSKMFAIVARPTRGKGKMYKALAFTVLIAGISANVYAGTAWRDCVPGSIGPGGCDSIGPGGGQSISPGGGQSIGPGGGLSIGPGGGQSIGPGGGQSIGPGGGDSPFRDRSRGLNTDTMRPYESPYPSPYSR
jgi:hypothetical protein